MTRRCSRIRSAATAFMTAAREACRELRCMVEAINADRAARPFLIASKNCLGGDDIATAKFVLLWGLPVARADLILHWPDQAVIGARGVDIHGDNHLGIGIAGQLCIVGSTPRSSILPQPLQSPAAPPQPAPAVPQTSTPVPTSPPRKAQRRAARGRPAQTG